MVHVAAAIEHDLLDASCQRTLRDRLSHDFGRRDIAATLERGARTLIHRTGRGQRASAVIIDHLRVDMIERTVNTKARTLGGALDALPHTAMHLVAVRVT